MSEHNSIFIERALDVIIEHGKLESLNWEEFSIILGFDNGSLDMTTGYAYEQSGKWHGFSITPRLIANEVGAYKDSLVSYHPESPIKVLFQFNRNSGRFHSELEYNDESKWKATPKNFKSFPIDIKPNLHESL